MEKKSFPSSSPATAAAAVLFRFSQLHNLYTNEK